MEFLLMSKNSKSNEAKKGKVKLVKDLVGKLFSSRKRVVAVVVFLFVLGFVGWRVFGGKKEEAQLQTATVERGTIVSSVTASGQVLVSNINKITSQASGTVKAVYAKDGDTVQKGQKIAEITLDLEGMQNQAQAYSSYLSAKNSLESAKYTQYTLQADMFSKWEDFKELAESDSYDTAEERALPEFHISENSWLAAEAKYKNQEAVIAQAQVALNNAWLSYQQSNSSIVAPTGGTITGIAIAPGMQIGSSDTSTGNRLSQRVAAVVAEGSPLASFNVSEIDVTSVKPGQKATITIDSIADKTFTGEVVSVDKIGSVSSGVTNYPVIIELSSRSEQILPNMAATANIIIDSKSDVLVVPSSAVQSQEGQDVVRVLRNGVEQVVAVETGLISDTETEITSGLSEGEVVVVGTLVTGQTSGGASPFGTFGGPGGGRVVIPR
jgi:macrolide-specific efflux system membrane fusion protein